VARNRAKNQDFKYVVLQASSFHITNLTTSDNSEEGIKKLKEVPRVSTEKMVRIAENLIIENKSIEKVILMDCIPRFDLRNNDPFGLRPVLAKFSNNLNRECINKSAMKNKIVVGAHTIDGNEANYGNHSV
jgi:hypothetical protein